MFIKNMDSWWGRLICAAASCGMLLLCALAYITFCLKTGYGIPCLFYTVTGLSCPGCGISRMFINIYKMRWHDAFLSNPAVFLLMPPALVYLLRRTAIYVVTGRYRENAFTQVFLMAVLVILVVFGVVRNLI